MIQERRFSDLRDVNAWKFDYEYPIISIVYSDKQYIVLYDNGYDKRDGRDFWGHYSCYPERDESNLNHSVEVMVAMKENGKLISKYGYYDYKTRKWMVDSAEKGYKSVNIIEYWDYITTVK